MIKRIGQFFKDWWWLTLVVISVLWWASTSIAPLDDPRSPWCWSITHWHPRLPCLSDEVARHTTHESPYILSLKEANLIVGGQEYFFITNADITDFDTIERYAARSKELGVDYKIAIPYVLTIPNGRYHYGEDNMYGWYAKIKREEINSYQNALFK